MSADDQYAENMRFYGDMRFKQLTVWLAGMTLFAAGAVQFSDKILAQGITVPLALGIVAPIFTGVVWIMEVRSTLQWVAHRQVARHLWPRANVKLGAIFSATNAVIFMYAATYAAWVWLGSQWGLSAGWITLLVFMFGVLVVFTVWNYVPLWNHKEEKSA